MRILVRIFVAVLIALIKIGDGVLYFFGIFYAIVNGLVKGVSNVFNLIVVDSVLFAILHIAHLYQRTRNTILLLRIRFQLKTIQLSQSVSLPKPTRYRKRHVSRLTFLPFFVKLKYFVLGTMFSFLFVFIPLLSLIFLQDLPHPQELTLRQVPQTTKIYDRNNTLLYQIYATQNRTVVPLTSVPKSLQQATVAIEDKDFYNHPGFDVSAIIRSVIANFSGKELQGGSTITQQLIKSALLTSETTLSRKTKEIILAFWAERIYSKAQILEAYLNQVPYGGTAWGIQAASEVYFGKDVKDLDLAESAFLAGIPRAPTIYSPYGTTPTAWKKRQKEVLTRMAELNYISHDEAQKALGRELMFRKPQTPILAPHFVMYIKELLVKKYGLPIVEKGGLSVTTTLDVKTQEIAEKIVADEVQNNERLHLTNGAALIAAPATGDIIAMVGSKDYEDGQSGNVNLTTSLRQPGSSIKVVTYATALSSGFTPATILDDTPAVFTSPGSPPYIPVNYDGKFHGKVTLRSAFANSFNLPAIKTLNKVGIPSMVETARKMGIKSWGDPNQYGLSLTLGAAETTMLDMATVYGTVANSGMRVDPNPFLKVSDYRGTILEEKSPLQQNPATGRQLGHRVLDEGVAYIISSILSDNAARALEFGSNSPLRIPGHTVSVKTGTSDNKRDNWTIGYTNDWVVVVWVGNNDNSPMSQALASGITGAAPIWNRIMNYALSINPEERPLMPKNIIAKPCLGTIEYFIRGTENSVSCIFRPTPSVSPSVNP